MSTRSPDDEQQQQQQQEVARHGALGGLSVHRPWTPWLADVGLDGDKVDTSSPGRSFATTTRTNFHVRTSIVKTDHECCRNQIEHVLPSSYDRRYHGRRLRETGETGDWISCRSTSATYCTSLAALKFAQRYSLIEEGDDREPSCSSAGIDRVLTSNSRQQTLKLWEAALEPQRPFNRHMRTNRCENL